MTETQYHRNSLMRFGTQGGGLCDGNMRWVEVPKQFPEFNVGDKIPDEWGTCAADENTHRLMAEEEEELDIAEYDMFLRLLYKK